MQEATKEGGAKREEQEKYAQRTSSQLYTRTVMADELGFERNNDHKDGFEEGMGERDQKLTLELVV